MTVTWGATHRPRKAEKGHTPIRYGFRTLTTAYARARSYVKCECGKTYSGNGSDGGERSHRQHQQREARKCQMEGCNREGIARPSYDANPDPDVRKQIGETRICGECQTAIDHLNAKVAR
jgi:hypothetical protein